MAECAGARHRVLQAGRLSRGRCQGCWLQMQGHLRQQRCRHCHSEWERRNHAALSPGTVPQLGKASRRGPGRLLLLLLLHPGGSGGRGGGSSSDSCVGSGCGLSGRWHAAACCWPGEGRRAVPAEQLTGEVCWAPSRSGSAVGPGLIQWIAGRNQEGMQEMNARLARAFLLDWTPMFGANARPCLSHLLPHPNRRHPTRCLGCPERQQAPRQFE